MSTSVTVRWIHSFSELSQDEAEAIAGRMGRLDFKRGETLVRQDDASDSVFVILSGRFLVYNRNRASPVAELGAGELVGETGFFSGAPRNATVIAARDSAVASLNREAFNVVVAKHPKIYQAIVNSLATRLAAVSRRVPAIPRGKAARTVAIVAGGPRPIPGPFIERLRDVFGHRGKPLFLDQKSVAARYPGLSPDDPTVSDWLNQCEYDHDLVVYLGDGSADAWTQKAVRQADQIVTVVSGEPTPELNAAEKLVLLTHNADQRRLVIAHERRPLTPAGVVATGTSRWLASRPVLLHHHVSIADDEDFSRLHRFLTGRAIGFVAGGGGGYGPAHVGIFKAFLDRGVVFDMVGGTSVGASMMAGFAMLRSPEQVDDDTKAIFISGRALKYRTVPRYGLLDHVPFDNALRRATGDLDVEDAWLPYFAVATDLSANETYILRTGPLWKAMRASGSIPGVLAPMFTDDGRMLVDGGLVDNIPLRPMRALKAGPNVVVHFGLPQLQTFPVDYGSIPGRWPLLARMLFSRKSLPAIPGPVNVLRRCLFANKTFDPGMVGPDDLVLDPPPFPGSSFLDFDRHNEVFEASYKWGVERIDKLIADGDPAMSAILEASRGNAAAPAG